MATILRYMRSPKPKDNARVEVMGDRNIALRETDIDTSGGGGGNLHRLGYGMCHFFRVLFWLKINFWVYFIAFN